VFGQADFWGDRHVLSAMFILWCISILPGGVKDLAMPGVAEEFWAAPLGWPVSGGNRLLEGVKRRRSSTFLICTF